MSTLLTACPPWCTEHHGRVDEGDLRLHNMTIWALLTGNRQRARVDVAVVDSLSTGERGAATVTVDGAEDLTVEQTRQLAAALGEAADAVVLHELCVGGGR